jgi:hypothetical protein
MLSDQGSSKGMHTEVHEGLQVVRVPSDSNKIDPRSKQIVTSVIRKRNNFLFNKEWLESWRDPSILHVQKDIDDRELP